MICNNIGVNNLGHLTFAGFDTVMLADKYKTPLYLIDENKVREKCRIYKNTINKYFKKGSFPLYAGKALCFKQLYRIMNEENMGIDVVSSGEIYTAFSAGFPMNRAFFHGNNKTKYDIEFAMDKNIGYFVCDNLDEIISVNTEAKLRGIKQKILLRVSPGIDPHTHAKITTGKVDSKFGAGIETGQALKLTETALSLENINCEGFHCHIGSQIFDVQPYIDTVKIMVDFISEIKQKYSYSANILDIGGGMGVRYTEEDPEIDYEKNIELISKALNDECQTKGIETPKILLEPGRSIVADAGMTLYTVGSVKEIPNTRNYVSIDGGMTDNPRYTLYSAPYTVLNASKCDKTPDYICTVAGRCCESGDIIQENVLLPKPESGDILAALTTGAYNYSMASNYNAIPKPPIIMLNNGNDYTAVKRETFNDMIISQI